MNGWPPVNRLFPVLYGGQDIGPDRPFYPPISPQKLRCGETEKFPSPTQSGNTKTEARGESARVRGVRPLPAVIGSRGRSGLSVRHNA